MEWKKVVLLVWRTDFVVVETKVHHLVESMVEQKAAWMDIKLAVSLVVL